MSISTTLNFKKLSLYLFIFGDTSMIEQIENGQYSLTFLNRQHSEDQELPAAENISLDNIMPDKKTSWQMDKWIYRIVVSSMSLTIILSLVGAVWLKANDKDIPDIMIALGTGSLGGIAGLLAPSPNSSNYE